MTATMTATMTDTMLDTMLDTVIPAVATRLETRRLPAPGRGQLVVTLDIAAGCHIQSHAPTEPFLIPTTVELDEISGLAFGAPIFPTPDTERFDWSPVTLDVYRGRVHVVVPVSVAPHLPVADVTIVGRVRYQACTGSACFPPEQRSIVAHVDLEPTRGIERADLDELAHRVAEQGPDRASDALSTLLDAARGWGVEPLLVAIAADAGQPAVARQRAIGRILVEHARLAGSGEHD